MTTRYMLRFDDICPTMDWKAWDALEKAMDDECIRPIVAVIPDNKDPEFNVGPANPAFWDRVRAWQAKDWGIGVHGYRHERSTRAGGIMAINNRSEFAGLGAKEQREKLKSALDIFARERVKPDAWVAPWHSFDATTKAALAELGVRVISDGFSVLPYRDDKGMLWVPQQLWRLRKMPFGLWTVCWHYLDWAPERLDSAKASFAAYRGSMMSLGEAVAAYGERPRGVADRLMRIGFPLMLKAKATLKGLQP
ncbi:MAG: DUF2334 domain-containing protein [Elusimicrobiota bacterium]